MSSPRHAEAAFETVVEHRLLGIRHVAISSDGFDRERTIFRAVVGAARL